MRARAHGWKPIGVDGLEPNAWRALKQTGSNLVVAGPGAGKTELLAQRAAFLLDSGLCPAPQRILAISFKVDAAANLANRIRDRLPEGESRRFVSLTFDALTKSLVDRFAAALPEPWKPTKPYDVCFPPASEIQDILSGALRDSPSNWKEEIAALTSNRFEPACAGIFRLPDGPIQPSSGVEFALRQWWRERLNGPKSSLTFTCLNRLAELAVRTNGQLRRALLVTYPFVFVDEFQDTTYAQYDFLLSAFADERISVTAVGDDKQRIMGWAGAREDSFSRFQSDFSADRVPLLLNHRSSPELVRVQLVLARAIDSESEEFESIAPSEIEEDAVQMWHLDSSELEAEVVADWAIEDMMDRGKQPRDYALLVRQRAADFEQQLRPSFEKRGLKTRNESRELGRTTLQNLLAEESSLIALAILRSSAQHPAPDAWIRAAEAMLRLRAVDADDVDKSQQVQNELGEFTRNLRTKLQSKPDPDLADEIADSVFRFLDPTSVKRAFLEYATGDALEIAIEAFLIHLRANAAVSRNWRECIDLFEGVDSMPLMTIHKSKGLEYDTVIFLGLDDDSWWSHCPGDREGRSTFFVALSRARQRAIFTYCTERRRRKVADLHELLANAHVRIKQF